MTIPMHLPPYAQMLGIIIADDDGNEPPILELPFSNNVEGRPGMLQGGAIGGLLEVAAVAAIRHMLGASDNEAQAKPINITIDYMRGARNELTRAQGTVTRIGSRVANVEAKAWQNDPVNPVAVARINFLLKRA